LEEKEEVLEQKEERKSFSLFLLLSYRQFS